MQITVATLRAAGCSEALINRIVEISDLENTAKRREQNRIAQQNHRSRQQCHADSADTSSSPSSPPSMVSPHTPLPLTTPTLFSLSPALPKLAWAFDLFWKAYPRKKAKKAAEKAFRKVEREGEITLEGLLAAVRRINVSAPEFIPYPASWLNAGEYLDDIAAAPGQRTPEAIEEDRRRGEYYMAKREREAKEKTEWRSNGNLVGTT